MLARFIAMSIIVLSVPLSMLLLWLWVLFAWATLFTGGLGDDLKHLYAAIFVEPNFGLALYIGRRLIGTFGGFIGWASLIALALMFRRPLSRIPRWIKAGCLVGLVSAIAVPAAPGLASPPILLCLAMLWLAHKRDA